MNELQKKPEIVVFHPLLLYPYGCPHDQCVSGLSKNRDGRAKEDIFLLTNDTNAIKRDLSNP